MLFPEKDEQAIEFRNILNMVAKVVGRRIRLKEPNMEVAAAVADRRIVLRPAYVKGAGKSKGKGGKEYWPPIAGLDRCGQFFWTSEGKTHIVNVDELDDIAESIADALG